MVKPEPTALAMAISSAQTEDAKRDAAKFRRELGVQNFPPATRRWHKKQQT